MEKEERKYIRKEKAKSIYCAQSSLVMKDRPLRAPVYMNGTIIPVRRGGASSLDNGGVITENGQFVKDSMIPGWITGWYDDYDYIDRNEVAVYCGRMIGHWGHFLLETITRLWYFLKFDRLEYKYVFIVTEDSTPPIEDNFKEFFQLLGIYDRLVFLNRATRYKKVIVPERSFQFHEFWFPDYIHVLDSVIKAALQKNSFQATNKKIYLTRSKFIHAQETEAGLSMLDNYFQTNGFKVLAPEKMTLSELIMYLQNAEECASESGTAAHNFLFCKKGQKTLIIERQSTVNEAQASIDTLRELQSVYVDAHLTLYDSTVACFLFYTPYMDKLTKSRKYFPPDPFFLSKEYIRASMILYREAIAKSQKPGKTPKRREESDIRCFEEAIKESKNILKQYLDCVRHRNCAAKPTKLSTDSAEIEQQFRAN